MDRYGGWEAGVPPFLQEPKLFLPKPSEWRLGADGVPFPPVRHVLSPPSSSPQGLSYGSLKTPATSLSASASLLEGRRGATQKKKKAPLPFHTQQIPTSSKCLGILKRRGEPGAQWGRGGWMPDPPPPAEEGRLSPRTIPPRELCKISQACKFSVCGSQALGIWSTLRQASHRLGSPGCQGSQKGLCLPSLPLPGLNPAAAEQACQPVSLASGSVKHGTHRKRRGGRSRRDEARARKLYTES